MHLIGSTNHSQTGRKTLNANLFYLLQCASMEVQLTSSAQEISQLRAQVSTLESELAAH